jgi:hypothetical protein
LALIRNNSLYTASIALRHTCGTKQQKQADQAGHLDSDSSELHRNLLILSSETRLQEQIANRLSPSGV